MKYLTGTYETGATNHATNNAILTLVNDRKSYELMRFGADPGKVLKEYNRGTPVGQEIPVDEVDLDQLQEYLDTVTFENVEKEEAKRVLIQGRRWFERVNGNTYCSAKLYINGQFVCNVGPEYGYGDYYSQMTMELLKRVSIIDQEDLESSWEYSDRTGLAIETDVTDVSRERDL